MSTLVLISKQVKQNKPNSISTIDQLTKTSLRFESNSDTTSLDQQHITYTHVID